MKYREIFGFSWEKELFDFIYSESFESILQKIRDEKAKGNSIYPSPSLIFNAYKLTPYDKVKVVILGTEPENKSGVNNGLAFSSLSSKRTTALETIFKEIRRTVPFKQYNVNDLFCCNDLTQWAKQGVLLLNTRLTVGAEMDSHSSFGWDNLITKTIKALNEKPNVIYLLWGHNAQNYRQYIADSAHIFTAPNPSAERFDNDTSFVGCNHFEEANTILKANKELPINWLITPAYCVSWNIFFNEEIVYYLPTYYNGYLQVAFGKDMLKSLNGADAGRAVELLQKGMIQLGPYNKPKKDEIFLNSANSLYYHLKLISENIYNKVGFFKAEIES